MGIILMIEEVHQMLKNEEVIYAEANFKTHSLAKDNIFWQIYR